MNMNRFQWLGAALVVLLVLPAFAAEGAAPRAATAGATEIVPVINDAVAPTYLFVQNADSGTYNAKTRELVLEDVGLTTYLSDRPHRLAGSISTEVFVSRWDKGKGSFKDDPPNAALSIANVGGKSGGAIVELVSVKIKPGPKGARLIYKVRILSGSLPAKFGQCSLFIDHGDGGAIAAGILGGIVLDRVVLNQQPRSQPQQVVVQQPAPPPQVIYVYGPPPGTYGYAPQPYYTPNGPVVYYTEPPRTR